MIVFFFLYAVLILWGIEIKKNNVSDITPLSFTQTNALKGLGILTVFFNHIYNDYLSPLGLLHHPVYDEPFVFFESAFTQLFVGMFLFFSGYGVYESFKKKGESYVNQMPVRRIGATLLNFDIAVLVFFVANMLLHVSLSPKNVILSFLAWESIGNSNWYIFAILYCYFANYISFKIAKSKSQIIIIIGSLVILYMIIMSIYKQPWWYSTILCYPAGIVYSEFKDLTNAFFQKKYYSCIIGCLVLLVLFHLDASNPLVFNGASVAFAFLCILLSMRIRLNSMPLIWIGAHLFPLYIYQRLPMLVIHQLYPQFIINTPFIFVLICITTTLLIGWFVPIIKLGSSK